MISVNFTEALSSSSFYDLIIKSGKRDGKSQQRHQ
jgi:hypothetical protein